MNTDETFQAIFDRGDIEAATALIEEHPELAPHDGTKAHPTLRTAIERNQGQCYKRPQLIIADLLTPKTVRQFRDAVIDSDLRSVSGHLRRKPNIVHAEFAAGRGIAQAIHHWSKLEVGQCLIDAGADVNAETTVNGGGETALAVQLRYGGFRGVKLLLESGADPNRGRIKFMQSKKMEERIKLLLKHGWNIDEGAGERTLMHFDAAHGNGAKIQTLLEHGADPNVRDSTGSTPLHLLAARGTGAEAIRALADAGADIRAVNDAGQTPLSLARAAESPSAARMLIALGAE